MRARTALWLLAVVVVVSLAVLVACSGGGGSNTIKNSGTAMVTTTISDPSTCTAPQGPYSHVYVTISDVKIHQSATAGPNDSGWVDLTPNLAPTQVDLLGLANNSCFLASLGSNVQITAGTYQQIRVILQDNSKASQVPNNQCGANAANCVVLGTSNVQPLMLSSESQTGIKIPSGQIAGGQFTVGDGQARDLNIDFNACASIVIQGNGQFRLKPVLHAGEVSTTASSISGKVVDSVTKAPINGGKTVVALEQVDPASGIDRVIMETVPDASGNFVFCPVPSGSYDVVAVAIDGNGVAYGATITTGVQPGNALGQLPLVATTGTSTAPATIKGQVTTANASNAGTSADISLSTLQSIPSGSSTLLVTIPQAATSSATLSLATATDASCPANTQCASYEAEVPALNPNVGAFSGSGTTYSSAPGSVTYTLDALAFVPNSGNTPDCTPPEQKSATPITVTAGVTVNSPVLAFTGCQ
jgi:hypothetical protein